ncbi:single-stranded-DNA-specific exonuclease RecJ [Deinococcus cellulosilyticus]|uniref:Single-stranded-DNA-specific exonuclease RecJ n=1 Tax=Deinococcus cellulosilyticus (strain DSM 18568 / NBRC 106333 / KACC 11606 / 5516J-15) TaxID=1223518 RepID=A0A511N557_DEIC1|nr:single-stranded-DNA-specific exonuclease RecJ [Deinococcus cellulosilyticus]GEM47982.1 single-stranded-DNA-specific exonuclease [Deinococcus cellulosilyticus NBRC 106333 = KACC 11606]
MKDAVWTLATPAARAELSRLMEDFKISPLMAQVFHSRGLTREHLTPEFRLSPNPALHEAASRVIAAMKARKRIRIHGDYDADGITASSVLVLGLKALGADVHAFIPHRLNEGYGMHPDKVPEHIDACDLLVTVDCGVTNLEEVRRVLEAGKEVIVTDHHRPGAEFPNCLVVHPHLTPNYDHDLHNLTGAGVAYHLLWAIHQQMGLPDPVEYSDIATIGTIADVAPLIGENRALVIAGLKQMKNSIHAGIRAALKQNSIDDPSARDVAFILAPRINAAGRLGEAEIALEFLTTYSERRAQELGLYLDVRNKERKEIQDRMFKHALQIVNPEDPAIVVTHEDWHAGIMGIVASKLLETFYKPVFIIAQGKGSVRSTPGISAVDGLNFAKDLLKRYGGHSGAAGFAIYDENIPELEKRLHAFVNRYPVPVRQVRMDTLLPANAARFSMLHEIEQFEPYGEGIRSPSFWVTGTLEESRQMGKEQKHYSFRVHGIRGKKWDFKGPRPHTPVDIAVCLGSNTYQNKTTLEFDADAVRRQEPLNLTEQDSTVRVFRMGAREAISHLKNNPSRFAVYAENDGIPFLQKNCPEVRLLTPEEDAPRILLMALPPLATLERWLQQAEVTFALGDRNLAVLLETYQHGSEHLTQHPRPEVLEELGVASFMDVPGTNVWSSASYREEALEAYLKTCIAQFFVRLSDQGFSTAVLQLFAAHHPSVKTPLLSI